jgi:hypothetical protein
MISFNKEYFNNNCYFFLKDKGDKISLYYSVAETLSESRKTDNKKDFKKKDEKKVKSIVQKFLNKKEKVKKTEIEKDLDKVDEPEEINELIGSDGSFKDSSIPFINMYLHPKKTMDQTVVATRQTNDPVVRGYRVYYGESEEKDGDVVKEIDFSDAFGYEETEDMDFANSVKTLKDMGVDNPVERTMDFGKLKGQKRRKGKLKQRLVEKDSLEEAQRQRMIKMVEDMLSKKDKDYSDVVRKDSPVSKILVKNLQSIKKIADKEGISINKLINILKTSE